MQVHLVDATYELFRAHFSPRPPVRGRDGMLLSGVSGLVEQLCHLLGDQGATHVGCATDRVVRSFRNDRFAGYKSDAGVDPQLLAQFPIAEAAIEALGLVLWPMVEFEADDAIAAAADRFADDPRVERIVICTPDKDLAQCVRGERVVLWDRRRDIVYDEAGVHEKWGVAPSGVADRLALVGDAADGFPGLPGWGDKSAAAVIARYGRLEAVPADAADWDVAVRGAAGLATTLRARFADALLFRDLATLRTAGDGVPVPQRNVDELFWPGADRDRWAGFCADWALPRLAARPPRWR